MTTDKTPATLAVDVLAVLDREIEEARKRVPFMHPEGPQNAEHQREYEEAGYVLVQLREARTAVAEMLSALQVAELALRERGLRACGEYKQIEAALARVKGESA